MKGKVLIVLVSLALVFGLLVASCDNGMKPANPYATDSHKFAGEFEGQPDDSDILDIIGGVFGGGGEEAPVTEAWKDFFNADGTKAGGDGYIDDYNGGTPDYATKSAIDTILATKPNSDPTKDPLGVGNVYKITYKLEKVASGSYKGLYIVRAYLGDVVDLTE